MSGRPTHEQSIIIYLSWVSIAFFGSASERIQRIHMITYLQYDRRVDTKHQAFQSSSVRPFDRATTSCEGAPFVLFSSRIAFLQEFPLGVLAFHEPVSSEERDAESFHRFPVPTTTSKNPGICIEEIGSSSPYFRYRVRNPHLHENPGISRVSRVDHTYTHTREKLERIFYFFVVVFVVHERRYDATSIDSLFLCSSAFHSHSIEYTSIPRDGVGFEF